MLRPMHLLRKWTTVVLIFFILFMHIDLHLDKSHIHIPNFKHCSKHMDTDDNRYHFSRSNLKHRCVNVDDVDEYYNNWTTYTMLFGFINLKIFISQTTNIFYFICSSFSVNPSMFFSSDCFFFLTIFSNHYCRPVGGDFPI